MIHAIYDHLNDYTSLFYSKNFGSSRGKKKYHEFFSTRNWRSLDLAIMMRNQCVICTECVNIQEFRRKTSNIGITERSLEEIPEHAERMVLREIEAQPSLQALRNNR